MPWGASHGHRLRRKTFPLYSPSSTLSPLANSRAPAMATPSTKPTIRFRSLDDASSSRLFISRPAPIRLRRKYYCVYLFVCFVLSLFANYSFTYVSGPPALPRAIMNDLPTNKDGFVPCMTYLAGRCTSGKARCLAQKRLHQKDSYWIGDRPRIKKLRMWARANLKKSPVLRCPTIEQNPRLPATNREASRDDAGSTTPVLVWNEGFD